MATNISTKTKIKQEGTAQLFHAIAAAEGRVKGRVSETAYQFLKNQEAEICWLPEHRLKFWLDAELGLSDGGAETLHEQATARPRKSLFEMAREAVEGDQRPVLGRRVIFTGRSEDRVFQVYIYHSSREQFLGITDGEACTSEVRVSRLNLASGPFWPFELKMEDYEKWAEEAREFVNGKE